MAGCWVAPRVRFPLEGKTSNVFFEINIIMIKEEEEALERAREAAKSGKFEMAPQVRIEALDFYVQKILDALGHPEALVSDESQINDFSDWGASKEDRDAWVLELSDKLGLPVERKEFIPDVALKLKRKTEA
jgi:hypothetical protein